MGISMFWDYARNYVERLSVKVSSSITFFDLPSSNVTLCLIAVSFYCFVLYGKKTSKVNQFLSSLPGPLNLPLVGCVLTILCQSPTYSSWMRILDHYSMCKMYRLSIFSDDFATSSDPEVIQAILRNSSCYDKDKTIYDLLQLPDILSTANGRRWLTERKAVRPSFHPKLHSIFDRVYHSRTNQLMTTLSKYAKSGNPFNLDQEMTLLFIDIMSESFLGVSADLQIKQLKSFAASLLEVPDCLMERFLVPALRYDFIWKICGRKKKYNAIKGTLYSVTKEIIIERRKHREERKMKGEFQDDVSKSGKRIFLDILLDDMEKHRTRDEHELIFEAGEIFTAGSVTMGTIASWVLLLSGIFPEVGKKLHKEIDTMMESCNGLLVAGECNKLEYLDMVLKETLRHFGVPLILRRTKENVHINDMEMIPANTRIMVMLAGLHHHPKYWEKPHEFYPEHFSPESVAKRPKNTFIPFSFGMRDCPGGKYAMQTMKCVLVQILYKMKFKAVGMKPWTHVYSENRLKFGFTQVPTKGFIATVKLKDKGMKD